MIIWSGGQTGVDRAAWDAAIACGLQQNGWAPKGRLAEDGKIAKRYQCKETDSTKYIVRTEKNLREANATLILCFGKPEGGTLATAGLCRKFQRPHLILDLDQESQEDALVKALAFLQRETPTTLNVAGPRASFRPDVYDRAFRFLSDLFGSYK